MNQAQQRNHAELIAERINMEDIIDHQLNNHFHNVPQTPENLEAIQKHVATLVSRKLFELR